MVSTTPVLGEPRMACPQIGISRGRFAIVTIPANMHMKTASLLIRAPKNSTRRFRFRPLREGVIELNESLYVFFTRKDVRLGLDVGQVTSALALWKIVAF